MDASTERKVLIKIIELYEKEEDQEVKNGLEEIVGLEYELMKDRIHELS